MESTGFSVRPKKYSFFSGSPGDEILPRVVRRKKKLYSFSLWKNLVIYGDNKTIVYSDGYFPRSQEKIENFPGGSLPSTPILIVVSLTSRTFFQITASGVSGLAAVLHVVEVPNIGPEM